MLVVVGGHSRNIGKTSVVAGIIRALPQWHWTAMKITQFGHGICSESGTACECSLSPEHPYSIVRERQAGRSDTGRFSAAGAARSYWVRTAAGQLGNAMSAIYEILASSQNVIVESNSIMQFLTPELYLAVLDFAVEDFKASSLRFLEQADACIVIRHDLQEAVWRAVPRGLWQFKRQFPVCPPHYVTAELSRFIEDRLAAAEVATARS
jgi:hypothetical protein